MPIPPDFLGQFIWKHKQRFTHMSC